MKSQTWIIIVKFKKEMDVESSTALVPISSLRHRRKKIKVDGRAFQIKEPTLIVPDGLDSVEVIPIKGKTVIHGRNFRRRLT